MPADDPIQQREIAAAMDTVARQRELDMAWKAHEAAHGAHDHVHALEHSAEREALRVVEQSLTLAFAAHQSKHEGDDEAVRTALAAVRELADIHSKAHEREHHNHEQRHLDADRAVQKAEQSIDKRLEGMNEVRQSLRDQSSMFASADRLETFMANVNQRFIDTAKHTDDRYEDNRKRIESIEKTDVGQAGRSLGQGTMVAIIVTAIGLVGTILAIVIAVSNILTARPVA